MIQNCQLTQSNEQKFCLFLVFVVFTSVNHLYLPRTYNWLVVSVGVSKLLIIGHVSVVVDWSGHSFLNLCLCYPSGAWISEEKATNCY